jgi:hypothetical protein
MVDRIRGGISSSRLARREDGNAAVGLSALATTEAASVSRQEVTVETGGVVNDKVLVFSSCDYDYWCFLNRVSLL